MLSGIALAAEVQVALSVADRTELRVRTALPDATSPHFDAATTPSVRLTIGDRRVTYSAGYLPTITIPDLQTALTGPEALHAGYLGVAWRPTRRVRLALVEDATYGQRNFAYLSTAEPVQGQTTPPPLQLLPGSQTLLFASTRTGLLSQFVLARQWGLTTGLAYSVSGGIDQGSRTIVPVQRGPRAEASLDYRATRLDRVTVSASAAHTDFSSTRCSVDLTAPLCSPAVEILDTSAAWGRRLGRGTDLTLSAGASTVRARDQPSDPYRLRSYPLASATYTDLYRVDGDHGLVRVDARVGPVIDFRTGRADQRVQGTGTATWTRRRTTVRVGANVAQSVRAADAGAVTLVGGDVELLYMVNIRLDLSTGSRTTWQYEVPLGSLVANVAFVAMTFHEPPLRF